MNDQFVPLLLLSGSPWYGHTTVGYLPVKGHLSCFQSGAFTNESCYKHLCTGYYVNTSYHFSGINAQKCNCWVIW